VESKQDNRYRWDHPRHRELMLECCATGLHAMTLEQALTRHRELAGPEHKCTPEWCYWAVADKEVR
jgi:hypothetical protein